MLSNMNIIFIAAGFIYFGILLLILTYMRTGYSSDHEIIGWINAKYMLRFSIILMVFGLILIINRSAHAQIQMAPGQGIQMCNTIGATTGGGVICSHNLKEQRIELNYLNPSWYMTFWGDGSAPSMLSQLCKTSNITQVIEVVTESKLIRTRTVPCSTGRSGMWVVHWKSES